jgi:hypothetical protein
MGEHNECDDGNGDGGAGIGVRQAEEETQRREDARTQ